MDEHRRTHREWMPAEKLAPHCQSEEGQGQNGADPEPPGHINQFGIGALLERGVGRLQRHPADRAAPGTGAPNLGMHRAGPYGPLSRLGQCAHRRTGDRGLCSGRVEISLRMRGKLRPAPLAAEIVDGVAQIMAVLCGSWVHRHSAYRIPDRSVREAGWLHLAVAFRVFMHVIHNIFLHSDAGVGDRQEHLLRGTRASQERQAGSHQPAVV